MIRKPDNDDEFFMIEDEVEEEDPWFLPPEPEPELNLGAVPSYGLVKESLFPVSEWRAAEGVLANDLGALCFDFGRLEERLRLREAGARRRLALQEVSGLGWWTGDRVPSDRLILWISLQIGATGTDAQALARGAWAVRRLISGPAPTSPEAMADLLAVAESAGIPDRVQEVTEQLAGATGLHPVVRACALFHLWRSGPSSSARDLEAAILAARLAGTMSGGVSWLPLSLAGFGGLQAKGTTEARLAAWIAGAHQSVLSALLHMDRLADWEVKANEAISDLSGRTPPKLLKLLADWPSVSAPMAEEETGASRAAVQRNLDLFTSRGLVRELTGQGRYRVWTARVV